MGKKRNSLGSTEIRGEYWSNGKGSGELRRNETYLYALIDLSQEKIGIAKNYDEALTEYNKQDLCYLCLKAIELSNGDNDTLYRFGVVIGNLIEEGKVYRSYMSIEAENIMLDNTVEEMIRRVNDYQELAKPTEFIEWFSEHILAYNEEPTHRLYGLGDTDSDELTQRAKDTGFYFVYLQNNVEDVYEGATDIQLLRSKIAGQEDYLNWIQRSGTNLTRESVLVASQAGIIRDMQMTPKEALDLLKSGKPVNGMGDPATLAALLSAIIPAIIAAAVSLVQIVISKKSSDATISAYLNNTKPSNGDIDKNAPGPGEYGYEKGQELQRKYDKLEDKIEFYDSVPDAAIIGVSISVWTLIFGSAIYSNRKKVKK